MKLIVSDTVRFDVHFTLNDAGEQVEYGFRMEAKRAKQPAAASGETVGDYLAKRAVVRMTGWVDDRSPLQADDGSAVPAGAQALEALYELLPNVPGLVLGAYLEATSAKAKAGN